MPPKKDQLREVISQLLYACGGDKNQYEETIDAIIACLESYLSQLTISALKTSDLANKIRSDDVIRALINDPLKQNRIQTQFEDKKKLNEERKSISNGIVPL